MDIATEKKQACTLVSVAGRMDALTATEFEKACQLLIEQGERTVVTDFSDLEYISSAGLRSILASAKKLKKAGGSIQFCGLKGMVEEVFRVSGFATLFTITDTAEEVCPK